MSWDEAWYAYEITERSEATPWRPLLWPFKAVLMGFVTEQAGLMERLFTALRLLLAPVRGALFAIVIVTAAVFAMATGIVGAAATVLGIMAAPIMTRTGYDARLAAGAITAGGTLVILIPPSVMLIVMGPVLGVSVADLYAAAMVPGFMLAALYLTYLLGRSFFNPRLGPPVPRAGRTFPWVLILREVVLGVVPLVGLIHALLPSDRRRGAPRRPAQGSSPAGPGRISRSASAPAPPPSIDSRRGERRRPRLPVT